MKTTLFILSLLAVSCIAQPTNLQGVFTFKITSTNSTKLQQATTLIESKIDNSKLHELSWQTRAATNEMEPNTRSWSLVFTSTNDAHRLWKWASITNQSVSGLSVEITYHACPRSPDYDGEWGPCESYTWASFSRTNK